MSGSQSNSLSITDTINKLLPKFVSDTKQIQENYWKLLFPLKLLENLMISLGVTCVELPVKSLKEIIFISSKYYKA